MKPVVTLSSRTAADVAGAARVLLAKLDPDAMGEELDRALEAMDDRYVARADVARLAAAAVAWLAVHDAARRAR